MAQLTDDCFAFDGPLMILADMERLIAERITPLGGEETIRLVDALNRVLARAIVAPIDLPPFDNSAVDGYAVRHADLASSGETVLRVAGKVYAGEASSRSASGSAVRIFTGAPMPDGADTVFMQEDVRVEGGDVVVPAGLKRGANRRLAGEDIASGAIALAAGRRLGPADTALCAAFGVTEVTVRPRVRVALFSTGNEIAAPGAPRPVAALYDANRTLLIALLAKLGAHVTDLGILRDDKDALSPAILAAAQSYDLVLTSGGVSTGDADHVRDAVESIGKLVFWRIGIKPGRPVAMGVVPGAAGQTAAFVGLPGNPVAAFVTFVRVVRPLLLRLAGATPERLVPLPVRLGFPYRKKGGRREYVRVSLVVKDNGVVEAHKHPQDGAGILTSLTATDGLVELTEDQTALDAGATVGFFPYAVLTA